MKYYLLLIILLFGACEKVELLSGSPHRQGTTQNVITVYKMVHQINLLNKTSGVQINFHYSYNTQNCAFIRVDNGNIVSKFKFQMGNSICDEMMFRKQGYITTYDLINNKIILENPTFKTTFYLVDIQEQPIFNNFICNQI